MIVRSLKQRSRLTLALIALIPLVALSLSLWMQAKDSRTQALDHYQNEALAIARSFENILDQQKERLEEAAVATGLLLAEETSQEASAIPQLLYMASGRFSSVVAINSAGELRYFSSALTLEQGQQVLPEPQKQWFFRQTLRSGRTTMSAGQVDGEGAYLYLGSPVFKRAAHKELVGLLAARVNVQKILQAVGLAHLPPNTALTVRDQRHEITTLGTMPTHDIVQASAPIPSTQWVLTITVPQGSLLTQAHLIALLGALLVGVIALIIYLSGRAYLKTLRVFFEDLSAYISALSHPGTALPAAHNVEMVPEAQGLLARFQAMAQQLARSDQALRQANTELESRVADRTATLAQRNQELNAVNALLRPLDHPGAGSYRDAVDQALQRFAQAWKLTSLTLTAPKEAPSGAQVIALTNGQALAATTAQPAPAGLTPALERFAGFLNIVFDNRRLYADTQRQHAGLQAVFSAMSEGFVLLDPAGQVLFSNDCFRQLAAQSTKAAGLPTNEELRALLSTEAMASVQKALAEPGTESTWQITPENGKARFYELSSFPVPLKDRDNQPLTGQALLIRDVTREHEVNRLKDDVIGLVSHELNNPIATLGIGLETLATRAERLPADLRAQITQNLRLEVQHLKLLVADWLDISMLNNGVMTCQKSELDLGPWLEKRIADWEEHNAMTVVRKIPTQPLLVQADPSRLRQVLRNLLDNARRYNDKDNPLIEVSARVVDNHVEIDVRDNGMGIAPEDLAKLFDRFYRGKRAQQHSPDGSGLGLAICRAIMKAHDGTLTVAATAPGEGTTFRLTLPLASPSSL